jgi:hypothetical protein
MCNGFFDKYSELGLTNSLKTNFFDFVILRYLYFYEDCFELKKTIFDNLSRDDFIDREMGMLYLFYKEKQNISINDLISNNLNEFFFSISDFQIRISEFDLLICIQRILERSWIKKVEGIGYDYYNAKTNSKTNDHDLEIIRKSHYFEARNIPSVGVCIPDDIEEKE